MSHPESRHHEERLGGKAFGLARLMDMGLPVPPWIALDAGAVRHLLRDEPSAWERLQQWLDTNTGQLVVRSSARREDGRQHSYAGVHESVVGVARTKEGVMRALRRVAHSSGWSRARAYEGERTGVIPVIIQQMVSGGFNGVLFTRALGGHHEGYLLVEWSGCDEPSVVSGAGRPSSLQIPWQPAGRLDRKRITFSGQPLSPEIVGQICDLVEKIRNYSPADWDVEWISDAEGKVWLVQIRPITREVVARGQEDQRVLPVFPGRVTGRVRRVNDDTVGQLQVGEVLVAEITEVNYLPAMQRAAAIVTEQGGLLSHAAIVARELGKPCIVGATGVLSWIREGELAEIDAAAGRIIQGERVFGNEVRDEIDWASLFLYDQGFEVELGGRLCYVETDHAVPLVQLDADSTEMQKERAGRVYWERFGRQPRVVANDKRIWHREWRRFSQLECLNVVYATLQAAVAAWDVPRLDRAISLYLQVPALLAKSRTKDAMHGFMLAEIGAAMHALGSIFVEGFVVLKAYRDSAAWRLKTGIPFPVFLVANPSDIPDESIGRILACLGRCSTLRNEIFNAFEREAAFDKQYFASRIGRMQKLKMASANAGEDAALAALYTTVVFRDVDCDLAAKLGRLKETSG